ncbi:30122_t:CDS:1, partial [Gigaspora margarita]
TKGASNTASTIAFRRRKAKVGTGMSSSNIGGEQKTSEDWLSGRELGNKKLLTLSISLCEKLGPKPELGLSVLVEDNMSKK